MDGRAGSTGRDGMRSIAAAEIVRAKVADKVAGDGAAATKVGASTDAPTALAASADTTSAGDGDVAISRRYGERVRHRDIHVMRGRVMLGLMVTGEKVSICSSIMRGETQKNMQIAKIDKLRERVDEDDQTVFCGGVA